MEKTTNENRNENLKPQDNQEDNQEDSQDNKLETNSYDELLDSFEDEFQEEEYKEIPLKKVEPEPTFKNSYTEKLAVASKKREEALKKGSNKYIKYSSIGMEMIGSVLLGGFGGNWLDTKLALGFPLFTIVLILLGLGGAFTHLIMQLNADRKAEEEEAKNPKTN